MKTPALLFVSLLAMGILVACGPAQQEVEPEDPAVPPVAEEAVEPEALSVDEVARKAIHAILDEDVEALKGVVQRTLSYYVDDKYVQDQVKHVADWDGEIRDIRYKKDTRTGLPLAVVYYADAADEKVKVTYLDRIDGQWYAMGGTWAFREIDRDEFYSYEEEFSAL